MLEWREMTRNGEDRLLPTRSFLSEPFNEKIGVLGCVDRGEHAKHSVERFDDLELRRAWSCSMFWIGYNLIMVA